MVIERNNAEIIIKISSAITEEDIQNIFDYIEFKELKSKVKSSQNQVNKLVNTIKKGRWNKHRAELIP